MSNNDPCLTQLLMQIIFSHHSCKELKIFPTFFSLCIEVGFFFSAIIDLEILFSFNVL